METVRLSEPIASEQSGNTREGLLLLIFMLLGGNDDSSRVKEGLPTPRFVSMSACLAYARPMFYGNTSSEPDR